MAGYSVSDGNNGGTLAVKAGIYPMKIARVDLVNGDLIDMHYVYYRTFTGSSTFSGGSTVSVTPMRSRAPAASAQCQVGNVSLPSTFVNIGDAWVNAGSRLQTDDFHSLSVGQATFQSPIEEVIAPGDIFGVYRSSNNVWTTIYFEELRL